MLEIVEERYGRGATLITSQIPVDRWHDLIGDPTLGDAILDRVIHNAHRLQLSGESLRKKVVQAAPAWPSAQHHGDTKPVQRAMRHPADIISECRQAGSVVGQVFRLDRWSVCRVQVAAICGSRVK